MALNKHWDARSDYLRTRCVASGKIFAGGLIFAFISLQFDKSVRSPAIWGIYAMAAGFAGYVVYNIRLVLHRIRLILFRVKHREKALKTNLDTVILSGGIR